MISDSETINKIFSKGFFHFWIAEKYRFFSAILLFASITFSPITGYSARPSGLSENKNNSGESLNPGRLKWVTAAHIAGFTGSMLLLNEAWYKNHPRSSFHFHDDLADWKQMDKGGHVVSAYHLSRFSHYSFRWAGLNNQQSALWGSISANLFLATIEILDGFSEEWGASWSDFAANLTGSASFYFQQIYWHEQKITWKYSFSKSGLQKYRPDLLGSNLPENMLKDYNGITYWLSFNMHSLLGKPDNIPTWLNISAGYGANGMLGSTTNPLSHKGEHLPYFDRYRSFYLAPDIDYSRIQTNSEILQSIFTALNFIKFPAPALEYNRLQGFRFHWIFF
ncbi:MAG: DUF2279 domain-containing protein [Bacteroidetes bacterium]|nr:MAG: DUF2279 domain-containing protein [Bacteroidota bacterium]